MAIVKHIAVHQSPLKLLRYILKKEKTEGMKFATGLCCNASVNDAYMEMGISFETFSGERFYKKSLNGKGQDDKDLKKETIKLHHYIQSFKPNDEEITKRLKARPAERMCGDDEFIKGQIDYLNWYRKNKGKFQLYIDNTDMTILGTAEKIADFVIGLSK